MINQNAYRFRGDRLQTLLNEIAALDCEVSNFLVENRSDKKRALEFWKKVVTLSVAVTQRCNQGRTAEDCALKISEVLRAQTRLLAKMNRLQKAALAFELSA
jgi:hypothetical protein